MSRPTMIMLVAALASSLAWACVGGDLDRDVDQDTDSDESDGDQDEETEEVGVRAPPAEGDESTGDEGSEGDEDVTDPEADPEPDPADDGSGLEPEDPGGHAEEDPPAEGTCVESCGTCTIDVDECCGHDICQDDWSDASRCMPVVPPHTGECPSAVPEVGSSCSLPGLICRYTGQTRCKCGCEGWNCPFGD